MSEIKLTADSGGGTTSIKAPSSTTSNADVVLKLPVADGSANQVLKTDGSGQLSFGSDISDLVNDTSPQLGGDLDTNSFEISLDDDHKVKFGASNDLQISHTAGGISSITHSHSGGEPLHIVSNGDIKLKVATSEDGIIAKSSGAVELYHDNAKVCETTAAGLKVQRTTATSSYVEMITSAGVAGYLYGESNNQIQLMDRDGHAFVKGIKDGAVELYYDNSKKFETRSDGVTVQSSGSSQGINVKHSNGNVVASMHNKGSGDEGYLVLYDAGEVATIHMDAEHGRITAKSIRLHTDNAANELDDYEEGSFSPTVSSGGSVSSYSTQIGYYIKIGRMVHWQTYMSINGSGDSGDFRLGSFPFTSGAYGSTAYGGATVGYANNAFQTDNMYMYMEQNTNVLMFRKRDGTAIIGNSANIFGNKDFILFGQYITA